MNGEPLDAGATRIGIGNRIAPPRFLMFMALMTAGTFGDLWLRHSHWDNALVLGFNLAALVFIASLWPLSRDHGAAQMRLHAGQNDANRPLVLLLTCVVMLAVMAAIASDLKLAKAGSILAVAKLIGTLALAWGFTNLVFMLHYAHAHYETSEVDGSDRGGFEFPGTKEPDYWDFLYFSFTAGMSFAASDVNVTRGAVRRVVVVHCLLSFIFSIGVIAFTINALGGAG